MATYPNVLFILVDDMGLGDLSCTGSQFYETPNVDRIAREGFVFTQGYAASRVCSPSRASIMTGKFTATHGITDWIGAASGVGWRNNNRHDKLLPADYFHGLSRREITLAEAFKSAGYKTFFAGKWHLGSEGSYPEDHGFDINKGGWEKGSPIGGYFSPWTNPKLEIELPGENLSMRLAKETVKFLRTNKDSSFFALLSFYAVHGPIQTTREKWSKYRDKAEARGIHDEGFKMERHLPIRIVQDNPVYAGLIEAMDDAVGLVLNELNELGLSENTIVVFTSDNGGVASGDSFSTSNLPLRGGKGYQWEGGIREPYFIKVPWMEAGGKTIAYPVSGVDFYPTLLDLASVGVPANQDVEGISLRPLMEGRSLPPRALYWHYPHYGNQGGDPSSMVRKENSKLIHYWEDGHDELYQLDVDPGERSNVASQHPEVVRELRENLDSWLIRTKAKTPTKDDLFDSTLAAVRHRDIVDRFWPELEQKRFQMLSRDFAPNPDWWGSQLTTD
jgi:arylsulfatase A-like enzyme